MHAAAALARGGLASHGPSAVAGLADPVDLLVGLYHGVVGLTRALALAVAPRGITVNALCPGWVDTDMCEEVFRIPGTVSLLI